MSHVVGVDLGGTSLRAAVVDTSTGSLVTACVYPHHPQPSSLRLDVKWIA